MASTHETIAYTAGKLTELLDTTVLTGTIVEVDCDLDTAKVNIGGTEYSNVPIFYHCADSEVVAGGSIAFAEGDSVYVLNKEGDLTITGFVDGLKSCGWKLKLYRDDDTTIRDEVGNITTPSGLPIDIYNLDTIYLTVGDINYAALPGHHDWASAYWVYNEATGIWTYDDSADWPDDWRKGTYNTNTGYFTIETMIESPDKLYWAKYSTAEPTDISDPAINEAVATYNIDEVIGIIVTLTKAGISQTLQNPTDIVAGRTFVVKASDNNGSYTISVNGIILSAGASQGFIWNGSSWEISTIGLPYGLNTQYPYRYKEADKEQVADKISMGAYEGNIPYWEVSDRIFGPEKPVEKSFNWDTSDPCSECPIFTHVYGTYGEFFWFKSPFEIKLVLKTSIPYKIKYVLDGSDAILSWYGTNYNNPPSSNECGDVPRCGGVMNGYIGQYTQPNSTVETAKIYYAEAGLINLSQTELKSLPYIKEFELEWKNPPDSISEIIEGPLLHIQTAPQTGICYSCVYWGNPYDPPEPGHWQWLPSWHPTNLDCVKVGGGLWTFGLYVKYE